MMIEEAKEQLYQSFDTILRSALVALNIDIPVDDFEAKIGELLEATTPYAQAVHVAACDVYTVTDRRLDCGDRWLCEKAPIEDRK